MKPRLLYSRWQRATLLSAGASCCTPSGTCITTFLLPGGRASETLHQKLGRRVSSTG